jgi:hypothetical protein
MRVDEKLLKRNDRVWSEMSEKFSGRGGLTVEANISRVEEDLRVEIEI